MKIKKLLMTVLCSLTVLACGKSASEKNTLVVGTNAEFAPFEYMEGQEIKGFDVDLINEIAKKIDKKIEWKNMSFDGLLPALQSKKIDVIIAGMTATEKRKEYVNFSQNYYVSQQSLVVADQNITSIDELKGQKIGVVLGYTGDVLVSSMPDYTVERFNSTTAAILGLQAEKVAAVVLDEEPAKQYVAKNEGLYVVNIDGGIEEYAIAVNKDDKELLAQIDKALDEIKSEGIYDEIFKKYFGN